jgi:hypothetical protein
MMTARRIEEAEDRLRDLRWEEWSDLALAALVMGLALGASVVHSPFAGPLFVGALAVGFLATRAFFRRWDFFNGLLLDGDAYSIPEVRGRAERIASMESRRTLAASARNRLEPAPGFSLAARVAAVTEELAALASELENEELKLDPKCAVRCFELLTNCTDSPLLNELLPAEDVQLRIRQIRAGFGERRPAA